MEKETPSPELPPRVLVWLGERRAEAERKLDEVCQRAIGGFRTVIADEIRGLSRRIEQMHQILDQLKQMVELQKENVKVKGRDERNQRKM